MSRPTVTSSVVVLIDVQDKLLAKIPNRQDFVRNVGFLLDAANLLGVPARATEQYPNGLGPTTPELAARLPGPAFPKTAFSCCGAPGFLADLRALGRLDAVLVGMETHVCVAQTALDLLEAGFRVHLPIDALASRGRHDHSAALRRMERAGAERTTAEAVAFEWVADSAHPRFKEFSKLIVGREVTF